MTISIAGRQVPYIFKISRRSRSLRLSVSYEGEVKVTAPRWVSERVVEQFVHAKAQWIARKIAYFKSFAPGVSVKGTKHNFYFYKDQALALAKSRIAYFNQTYGFVVNKIQVRNQKTRWGSCSRKGNISFNFKIALLSPHQADYLIVHELCHLGAFNHSQQFWDLVARTIPDHKAIRKEMKKSRLNFS